MSSLQSKSPKVSSLNSIPSHKIMPTADDLILSISSAICSSINNSYSKLKEKPSFTGVEFSEYFFNFENCEEISKQKCEIRLEKVFSLFRCLHKTLKISQECFILIMIYIKKFISYTEIPLLNDNWENIALISTLISQRVSDNSFMCASIFTDYFPQLSLREVEFMEIEFLNRINYNYLIEKTEYLEMVAFLQDAYKSYMTFTWEIDVEKVDKILERSKWLTVPEEDSNTSFIIKSDAMSFIDLEEIEL